MDEKELKRQLALLCAVGFEPWTTWSKIPIEIQEFILKNIGYKWLNPDTKICANVDDYPVVHIKTCLELSDGISIFAK